MGVVEGILIVAGGLMLFTIIGTLIYGIAAYFFLKKAVKDGAEILNEISDELDKGMDSEVDKTVDSILKSLK